ncbi:MAG: hypothetical protein MZV64_50125 [Ignavibacteriales bacterium]|nr:hypothetical protein [Ignavibacteriales bacterium]
MPEDLLESYIAQHIAASPDDDRPLLLARRRADAPRASITSAGSSRIERRLCPPGRTIANGLQTNGTLLDDDVGPVPRRRKASPSGSASTGRGSSTTAIAGRATGSPRSTRRCAATSSSARHGVPTDILCVVGAHNVRHPARGLRLLPGDRRGLRDLPPARRAEARDARAASAPHSVPAEAWGDFLCAVFDEWVRRGHRADQDPDRRGGGPDRLRPGALALHLPAGLRRHPRPRTQRRPLFLRPLRRRRPPRRERSARRRSPNCSRTPPSGPSAGPSCERLPRVCRTCEVLAMCNGECPKNRFVPAPDGGPDLNYLCAGYKKFFCHVRPFVDAVAAEWRRQNAKP